MKFLPTLLLCLLCSCALFKSEPASLADATPPAGYHPVYINNVAPYTPSKVDKPAFYLSRVEANEPNKIKLYMHLVDSNGNYLSGAAKMKNLWCSVYDVCNGKRDQIKDYKLREVTEDSHTPTAIALVMDHSGSMGEPRAHAVQDAAEQFISRLQSEDMLAIIKYDNKVVVEAPLSGDKSMLRQDLKKNGLEGYGGFTAIADAIDRAVDIVSNAKGYDHRAVVVFTDGRDNSSSIAKDSVIRYARSTNTLICAVDFGENINKDYMTEFSDGSGGTHHQVYRTAEFEPVFEDIYKKLKNYYVMEYIPREYGDHTVSLKLCLPKDTAFAVRSFNNSPKIGEIALLDVNFELNSATINSSSTPSFENAEYMLKAFPNMTIELRGHTDNTNNTGDKDYNKKLSQKRADAVKAELVKRGIAGSRINAIGFGDTIPVADNSTDTGRAKNRRTEFTILSK